MCYCRNYYGVHDGIKRITIIMIIRLAYKYKAITYCVSIINWDLPVKKEEIFVKICGIYIINWTTEMGFYLFCVNNNVIYSKRCYSMWMMFFLFIAFYKINQNL